MKGARTAASVETPPSVFWVPVSWKPALKRDGSGPLLAFAEAFMGLWTRESFSGCRVGLPCRLQCWFSGGEAGYRCYIS